MSITCCFRKGPAGSRRVLIHAVHKELHMHHSELKREQQTLVTAADPDTFGRMTHTHIASACACDDINDDTGNLPVSFSFRDLTEQVNNKTR